MYARDISRTGISACDGKRRRIGIFFPLRIAEDAKKIRPSWRHRRLSRKRSRESVSGVCVLEVIVIGLLLDFIDPGGCRQQ